MLYIYIGLLKKKFRQFCNHQFSNYVFKNTYYDIKNASNS